MTETEIELIRTLGEYLPPTVIEKWIEYEKKKMQQEKIKSTKSKDNNND